MRTHFTQINIFAFHLLSSIYIHFFTYLQQVQLLRASTIKASSNHNNTQKQKVKSQPLLKLCKAPKVPVQQKPYILTECKDLLIHIASFSSYFMMSLKHVLKPSS